MSHLRLIHQDQQAHIDRYHQVSFLYHKRVSIIFLFFFSKFSKTVIFVNSFFLFQSMVEIIEAILILTTLRYKAEKEFP